MATEKGRLIGRGRTAEIFSWGNNQVLKLYQGWCPAHWVEEEVRGTQAAYQAGLPVPTVEGIVEVEGRQGIIFERIEGPSMLDELSSKPWKLGRYAQMMAELHAAMHSCKLPELSSQQEGLKTIIRDRISLPSDVKEAVLKALEQLPDGSALCHGDFHPENIIMSSRGPIIIDWLTAKRGNPLGDVARSWVLIWYGNPPSAGYWQQSLINSFRALFWSIYLKRYLRLRPSSRQEIESWLLPVMAARLAENVPGEEERFLRLIEKSLQQRKR